MQKWEHTVAYNYELSEYGVQGWEAVGVLWSNDEGEFAVLMKRPLADPDAVKIEASLRYGIFLNTGPTSSGWLKDANGYVMSSTSRIVMEAQASELDGSWGAEVRLMP